MYLKTDVKHILFTDERWATLDGSDGWSKRWVFYRNPAHMILHCQQGGREVMFWLGTLRDNMISSFKEPETVKINASTNCDFIMDVLTSWKDELPHPELSKVIFCAR